MSSASEVPLGPGEAAPTGLTPALPEASISLSLGGQDLDSLTFDATTGVDYNSLPTYPVRPSYRAWQSKLRPSTQCVVFDGCPQDPHKPSSTPIYQTAVRRRDARLRRLEHLDWSVR